MLKYYELKMTGNEVIVAYSNELSELFA